MVIEKNLLMHWWFYYGKGICSLAEVQEFEKIIDEYGAERVFDVAVASYICGDGSPTVMLGCIRNDSVKKLFDSLPDVSTMTEEEKEQYEAVREELFQILSKTS